MRVLFIHNRYLQAGGEDAVVRDEQRLLRERGVTVDLYERDNIDITELSKLKFAVDTVWSRRSYREVGAILDQVRPHVVHCHNTFPLVSPSVYWAAGDRRIPVVQSLHNFRLVCPQAFLLRNDKPCEDCLGAMPWRGIVRRCYHGSAVQTAVIVGMIGVNRALGTYRNEVQRYIALNNFCRDKFIAAGLPAQRIATKPNFVDLGPVREHGRRKGALFVGRLAREKGVHVIAQVFRSNRPTGATLEVMGEGPEAAVLGSLPGVRMAGIRSAPEIYEAMAHAAYLLMPSLWYENFPRVLVEAFACGLPVITSRLGSMAELVDHGETGLLVEPGDAEDLADAVAWANEHPDRMREMGLNARRQYESLYTGEANFNKLMQIYRDAMLEVDQEIVSRSPSNPHRR
jgi:glycosyltransferase involved in cell wall biosynthesis